jgi:hypothetical protein
MTFVSVAEVRYASGVPSSLVSDAAITHAITIVEGLTARKMNTKFTPTKVIEIIDGTGTDRFFTKYNPLLKVISLTTDGNTVDVTNLDIYENSGRVILGTSSDYSSFVSKNKSIICQYLHGLVEEDDSLTALTSGAESAGSSVVVAIDSDPGFAVGDYVFVYGTDGYREVAKITSISETDITVDQLLFSHVANSIFVKATIPQGIKRFIELEATIYVALNAIGATYTFSASYSVGDLQVTKGVPYTHWRESLEKAIKERDTIKSIIKPRIKIYT